MKIIVDWGTYEDSASQINNYFLDNLARFFCKFVRYFCRFSVESCLIFPHSY